MNADQANIMEPTFRVLATAAMFEPGFRGGGPIRSLARIVDTASDTVDISLVTSDREPGSTVPFPGLSGQWVPRGRSRVFYFGRTQTKQWISLVRVLRAEHYDLLYLSSLWDPMFTVVPILAARLGLIRASNILLAPHGELSPGALSMKASKKRMFLHVWRPLLRRMKVEWHACTEIEEEEINKTFPDARVIVVRDMTSLPYDALPVNAVNEGPVRFVFISRISPMKNLVVALEALRRLTSPADFDIYGPAEDPAYWSRCKSLIDLMPDNVRVSYQGELTPENVRETFGKYDAFIFPTLGEGFGHVIAESLSASCPVICSAETPWTEILEAGGGAVVRDLTPTSLAAHLQKVALMDPAERLGARRSAADAYASWRKQQSNLNVLDVVRHASCRPS
jgi:glycosyltransferase involved in cell wall biosynthesis